MKFSLTQKNKERSSRARGFAPLLVLTIILCAAYARAQDIVRPAAPRTPTPVVAPRPAVRPGAQQQPAPVAEPSTRVARPAAATAPPAGAQAPTPSPKAAPAIAPMLPRQVVTVVHRLRGWKLLAWLATRDPFTFELDELPSSSDVHTNIVAGYISEDGRTVVARLPQAEADLDSFPAPPSDVFAATPPPQSAPKAEAEYTIITPDGRKADAKFVGLDAATGLTLLEASSPLGPHAVIGAAGDTEDPTVGQRVLFYTPALAPPARAPIPAPTPGYIYVNIDEKEGRLTEVRNGPSGRPFRLVARTPAASPEWTGAVAANEIGEVVGIVSQTGTGETQIMPVAAVIGARERVMKLRANAPQPWIGVRGDAAFQVPLETWVGFDWKPETAFPHIHDGLGVFLTSVAPGAPAAVAGLKPGDLISRIGARDVRTAEDLSLTLKEASVGSSLDFTVWRASEPAQLKFTVRLAAAQNPALETLVAEGRAADSANVNSSAASPEMLRAFEAMNPLRAFGLGGMRITPRGASRLGARGGLLVVAVRPGSPAEACGLRAGDVIETANGLEFKLTELRRMLSRGSTEPVSLGVVRQGARTTIVVNPLEVPLR
jgi:S1-C subfamily serine protease